MIMFERRQAAIKSKLCIWCLDPEVEYTAKHKDDCRVQKEKIKRFSCEVSRCKTHMWLCSYHKQQNHTQLQVHQDTLKKKGLTMGLTTWCNYGGGSQTQPQQLLDEESATKILTKAVRKAAKDSSIQEQVCQLLL